LLQDVAGRNELANRLAKGLADKIQGFSKQASEELAEQMLLAAERRGLAAAAQDVIRELVAAIKEGDFRPRVYFDDHRQPVDFHAFPLSVLENACVVSAFENISDAIEYYYSNKAATNRIKQKTSDLSKAVSTGLDKLYLKKQRLSEDLIKAENAEIDRLYGELVTANLHNIRQGLTSVTLDNYYDGSQVTISLDSRLNPSQNAQRYFRLYSKAKTALVEKKARLIETERDIEYLKSVLTFIENASSAEDADALRLELMDAGFMRRRKAPTAKKNSKSTPLSYELTGGFKAMAGRNNSDNDMLTFKKASGKDIWLHTKDIPGSHVILFTNGVEVPPQAIFEAAAIAAWHSGARSSGNVPVDYTLVKYVKKPSGAKPGMVIFTNNRTVYVDPLLP
jgi:predicted ribosome quality control (RQC) complex YloA/Tae2 family protein